MQDDDGDFADWEDEEDTADRPHGLRFGEGQPINRRGRPRGSPNMKTIIERVAKKRFKITVDGKVQRKSAIALVLMAIQKKASEGNLAAFKLRQRLIEQFGPQPAKRQGVLIVGEKLTNLEWGAAYGCEMTDEEVRQQCPYMMRRRREHQQYMKEQDARIAASMADYELRKRGR
jgi:hypothetical protein